MKEGNLSSSLAEAEPRIVDEAFFYKTFFDGEPGPGDPISEVVRRVRDSVNGVRLVRVGSKGTSENTLGLVGRLPTDEGLPYDTPLYTMSPPNERDVSGRVVLPLAFLDVKGSEKTTPLSTEAMQLCFATVALVRGLRGEGDLTVRTPLYDPAWPHDITIVDEAPDLGLRGSYTGRLSDAPAVTEAAQKMAGFGENGKKFTTAMRQLATAAFGKLNESDPSTLKRVFTAPLIGFDLPEKPPRK
ncbi:MAG: hypothetical protein Q4B05_01495 [Candidatus Saccharibacteria bacterium]|nr:hypothetical protein [Candidatus Saccharibacteria bacterium]